MTFKLVVKEIAQLGGDVTKFVSPSVRDRLLAKAAFGPPSKPSP